MLTDAMDVLDLTVSQLRRAAALKERIDALNNELRSLLSVSGNSGAASKDRRAVSATGKRNPAAKPTTLSGKPAARVQKKAFSAATRAKLSAKLKAYWAAKKAG